MRKTKIVVWILLAALLISFFPETFLPGMQVHALEIESEEIAADPEAPADAQSPEEPASDEEEPVPPEETAPASETPESEDKLSPQEDPADEEMPAQEDTPAPQDNPEPAPEEADPVDAEAQENDSDGQNAEPAPEDPKPAPFEAQEDDPAQEEPAPDDVTQPADAELQEDDPAGVEDMPDVTEISPPEPLVTDCGTEDNETLYEGYLEQIMMEDVPGFLDDPSRRRPAYTTSSLTGNDARIYPILKKMVQEVASGKRSSTRLTLSMSDLGLKTVYTAADLGVSAIVSNNAITQSAVKAYEKLLYFNGTKVNNALQYDMPFEYYWCGRYISQYRPTLVAKWNSKKNEYDLAVDGNYIVSFLVWQGYRLNGDEYKVDPSGVNRAKTAANNAKAIVQRYASLGDYDKLENYRHTICSLNTYNHNAADMPDNGNKPADPWQLIYVFDYDSSTNVVCEGYAKAFQYLFDLSTFRGDLSCITVSGTVYQSTGSVGSHRWNVVRRADRINYLVDITFCDSDSGENTDFFLASPEANGSIKSGYTIRTSSDYWAKYVYNEHTLSVFSQDTLTLGKRLSAPTISKFTGLWHVFDGMTATFNVSASGTWLAYQWQFSKDGGYTWENFTGKSSKTAKLSFKAAKSHDGRYIRCAVTDANGLTSYTSASRFSVSSVKQPKTQKAAVGETIKFSVEVTGTGLTYQWKRYNSSKGKWENFKATGSTTATMTFTMSETYKNNTFACIISTPNATFTTNSVQAKVWACKMPKMTGAQNVCEGVKITWEKSAGAAKYRIFRKYGSGNWEKLGDTKSLSFTDKTPVSGKKYTYTVRCLSSDNNFSSGHNSKGKAIKYIAAPVISKLESINKGVKITWKAVAGAVNYRVLRKGPGDTKWKKVGDTTGTTFTDQKAAGGKSYLYTVRCMNADGTSATSGYNGKGKSIKFIAAPVLNTVQNVYGGVKITWKKSAGAVKYRVFRKYGSGSWEKLADTKSASYTDKTAASGKKYSYTVRCISSDGKKVTSGYNTKGKAIKYIAAPVISKLESINKGVKITWKEVAGAVNYRVLRKGPGDTKWKKVTDTTDISFTDQNVTGGKTYLYSVRCMTADGTSATSGYYGKGKSIKFITAPAISSLQNVYDGVKITWSKSAGAAKYRVFRRTSTSEKWAQVGETTGAAYTDKTAASGKKYLYTVRCISADGKKVTSGYNTRGKQIYYIAAPRISKLQNVSSGIKLSWGAVNGAEKYVVLRKAPDASKWTKLKYTTGTSFTDKTAVGGKTYLYSVRCVSEDEKTYTSGYNGDGLRITRTNY